MEPTCSLYTILAHQELRNEVCRPTYRTQHTRAHVQQGRTTLIRQRHGSCPTSSCAEDPGIPWMDASPKDLLGQFGRNLRCLGEM